MLVVGKPTTVSRFEQFAADARLSVCSPCQGRIDLANLMNWIPSRLRAALRRSVTDAGPDSVPLVRQADLTPSANAEVMEICAREAGLDTLPNDLTKMLYLASLRDCNSGCYLHPQLSQRFGVDKADRALCACHDQVFRRLLTTPVSGYVLQLEEYIRYTRAERSTVLRTWLSLQAYRATMPVLALSVYSELFCLNIELALTILNEDPPRVDTKS